MVEYDFSGKTALITGCSAGLGREFAYAYAEAGANLVLASRRTEVLDELAEELSVESGAESLVVNCDVLIEEDIAHAVEASVERFGGLDILINTVGNYLARPLIEQTIEDWRHVIDLNLTSAFIGSREAARVMIPQESGCIINMASTFAFGATRFPVVGYYAAKGGVVMLTKALAVELGPHNIRVNAIAPGFFPTKQSIDAMEDDEIREKMIEPRTALPYLAEKEWIRGAACFLASDDAKYVTGHVLSVDGGWLAF